MGIGTRFLLFLFAAVSLAAAGTGIGIASGLLPEAQWLYEARFLIGRPETLAGLGVYFVVGLCLFFASFLGKSKGSSAADVSLIAGPAGEVRVAVPAIRELAERVAISVRGVREAKAHVTVVRAHAAGAEDGLTVSLELLLGTEAPVKEVASAVHDTVADSLATLLGLSEIDIRERVSAITQARLPRKARVS